MKKEPLNLPEPFSIITEVEYYKLLTISKQEIDNPITIYRCDLSIENNRYWTSQDISLAQEKGVWNNGHSQVRIVCNAATGGRYIIVYVKNEGTKIIFKKND